MLGRSGPVTCIVLTLCLVLVEDAEARRGLRIDFGAWGPGLAPLGSASCPHTTQFATWTNVLMAPGVFPYGYSFWIHSGTPFQVLDGYCQYTTPYSEGFEIFEYLNNQTIPADEPGLRYLVGDNQCGGVTAMRYTYLNGSRFDEGVKGAQWAFYFFPGGQTIAALYSELEIDELGYSPQVIPLFGDYFSVWAGTPENPDGYFLFIDGVYVGPWDGEYPIVEGGPVPAESCPPPPVLIFDDGFEGE